MNTDKTNGTTYQNSSSLQNQNLTIKQILDEARGEKYSEIFGYTADRNTQSHLDEIEKAYKLGIDGKLVPGVAGDDFDEYYSEFFEKCLKKAVKGYNSSKDKILDTCRKLADYVRENYDESLNIRFPEIEVSNRMERMIYIAKATQSGEKSLTDIAEDLWISTEQIGKDYLALSGEDEENAIKVCGKPFIIDNVTRSRGRLEYESTAHPLFFGANISQVMAMLKGLKQVESDPNRLTAQAARGMATDTWSQLSDYARKTILTVFRERFEDEEMYRWCRALDQRTNRVSTFTTERTMAGSSNRHKLEHAYKLAHNCDIEYRTENGSIETTKDCKIKSLRDNICTVITADRITEVRTKEVGTTEDRTTEIPINRITSVKY